MENVIFEEGLGEIKIFFSPSFYMPVRKDALKVVNFLIFNGNCSGACLDRLVCGEIRIFFNPTYHQADDREFALMKLRDCISKWVIE